MFFYIFIHVLPKNIRFTIQKIEFTAVRLSLTLLLAFDKFFFPARICSVHVIDHWNNSIHSLDEWFSIYGFREVFVHSPKFICQLIICVWNTHCRKEISKFNFWYLASLIAVNSIKQFVPLSRGEKCVELSWGQLNTSRLKGTEMVGLVCYRLVGVKFIKVIEMLPYNGKVFSLVGIYS